MGLGLGVYLGPKPSVGAKRGRRRGEGVDVVALVGGLTWRKGPGEGVRESEFESAGGG